MDGAPECWHACRTVNDLIWKEIQEKNAQFKADNDAFWEAEQVFRKWNAEDRKRRRVPSPLSLLWLARTRSARHLWSLSGAGRSFTGGRPGVNGLA